jgi:hypothetical protein
VTTERPLGHQVPSASASPMAGLVNVALGKAAEQSSYSEWSSPGEAGNAVSGSFPGDFAFHTDIEDSPWWRLDLGAAYPIEAIVIHNRILSLAERARTLKVESSQDGLEWTLIHAGLAYFGTAASGNPFVIWLGSHLEARYLRLSLTERESLHLSQVEVFVKSSLLGFKDYCEKYHLPRFFLSTVKTLRNYQIEKNDDAISDTIVGLKINYSGRFGNLLIQYINCIQLARRTGLKFIQLGSHELFDVTETFEVDGITFLPATATLPRDGAFIAGEFFNSDDFVPVLSPFLRFGPQEEIEFTLIVQEYIRPRILTGIPLPGEIHPEDELTIHLRAGDIFSSDHAVTYGYRQPPLSFYVLVINRMRESGRINKVRLVFEDRGNPCVNALEQWLTEQLIPYRITSGSLHEDMSALIDAPHLVFGHGTFGYAACRLSKQVQTVHFFAPELGGSYRYMPNIGEAIKVVDRAGNYIKAFEYGVPFDAAEGWRNTPVMREIMLTYPIDWLEIEDRSTAEETPVALTYANDKVHDGAGAQLQRIYGIFALSRALGVSYVHTPLLKLDYQGIQQLQIGKPDNDIVAQWNTVYHIDSDVHMKSFDHIIEIEWPETGFHEAIIEEAKKFNRPTLVRITFPHKIIDKFPDFYEVCKLVSPFRERPDRQSQEPLRVAIHLRRGDVKFADPARLLPNSYYVETCLGILGVLQELGLDWVCELHTEVPEKEAVIRPGAWSAFNVNENVTIGPDDDALGDFDVIPNLIRCYNEHATLTFEKLATADILIISKSSFSYLAAILNVRGVIIYHPFWHSSMRDWVVADLSGNFDTAKLKELIQVRTTSPTPPPDNRASADAAPGCSAMPPA